MDLAGILSSKLTVDKPELKVADIPSEADPTTETSDNFAVLVDQAKPAANEMTLTADILAELPAKPELLLPNLVPLPMGTMPLSVLGGTKTQPETDVGKPLPPESLVGELRPVDADVKIAGLNLNTPAIDAKTAAEPAEMTLRPNVVVAARDRPVAQSFSIESNALKPTDPAVLTMAKQGSDQLQANTKTDSLKDHPMIRVNPGSAISAPPVADTIKTLTEHQNTPSAKVEIHKLDPTSQNKSEQAGNQPNLFLPTTSSVAAPTFNNAIPLMFAENSETRLIASAATDVIFKSEQNLRPAAQASVAKIAEQIAVRITNTSEPRIEIRLDPPELGRVTIQMSASDTGMQAILTAERPDIADLMRRHLDVLAAALDRAGFAQHNLQFRSDEQASKDFDDSFLSAEQSNPEFDSDMADDIYTGFIPGTSLDIRL